MGGGVKKRDGLRGEGGAPPPQEASEASPHVSMKKFARGVELFGCKFCGCNSFCIWVKRAEASRGHMNKELLGAKVDGVGGQSYIVFKMHRQRLYTTGCSAPRRRQRRWCAGTMWSGRWLVGWEGAGSSDASLSLRMQVFGYMAEASGSELRPYIQRVAGRQTGWSW